MSLWGRVDADVIVEGPDKLPRSWVDIDGNTHLLRDLELRGDFTRLNELNWFIVQPFYETYNNYTHKQAPPIYTFSSVDSRIDANFSSTPLSSEELSAALVDYKTSKINELKQEALSRIQQKFPDIESVSLLMLEKERWLSIAPAARSATADYQYMIDVAQKFQTVRDYINSLTLAADVDSYDVTNTPTWPTTP